ncbi:MAG: hypothetical protein ACLVKI_01290 [Gordonibacter urolithinfaciens]
MNDNKNSKARHARHAAPAPQPDGGDAGGPMPAGQRAAEAGDSCSAAPDKDREGNLGARLPASLP